MREETAAPLIANSIYFFILLAVVFLALVVAILLRQRKEKPVSGKEEIIGQEAVVKTTLSPNGEVFLMGEIWKAHLTSGTAHSGEIVRVKSIKGLLLTVEKF
ncbi:MAG: NfeD family protein [bacterium]